MFCIKLDFVLVFGANFGALRRVRSDRNELNCLLVRFVQSVQLS